MGRSSETLSPGDSWLKRKSMSQQTVRVCRDRKFRSYARWLVNPTNGRIEAMQVDILNITPAIRNFSDCREVMLNGAGRTFVGTAVFSPGSQ